jgi:hypothetical protein
MSTPPRSRAMVVPCTASSSNGFFPIDNLSFFCSLPITHICDSQQAVRNFFLIHVHTSSQRSRLADKGAGVTTAGEMRSGGAAAESPE